VPDAVDAWIGVGASCDLPRWRAAAQSMRRLTAPLLRRRRGAEDVRGSAARRTRALENEDLPPVWQLAREKGDTASANPLHQAGRRLKAGCFRLKAPAAHQPIRCPERASMQATV
jgi:hypothetical protein